MGAELDTVSTSDTNLQIPCNLQGLAPANTVEPETIADLLWPG